jgi:hypothetical protein
MDERHGPKHTRVSQRRERTSYLRRKSTLAKIAKIAKVGMKIIQAVRELKIFLAEAQSPRSGV